ncbi:MAG: M67 family metallopeptidase [Anaerolineales bacterium]|nr:M67 family metallopeptidase [Anaerolineales bacterium]
MLEITQKALAEIHAHGADAYPDEGAGFLLGAEAGQRQVTAIFPLENSREDAARHNRYLITPQDYLKAEIAADKLGLSLIGVFHSHPDHPNLPSEFDREWAQPFFSYIITSVAQGQAVASRSWRLAEDRSKFEEETIQIVSCR